jgi:hypothetical protein
MEAPRAVELHVDVCLFLCKPLMLDQIGPLHKGNAHTQCRSGGLDRCAPRSNFVPTSARMVTKSLMLDQIGLFHKGSADTACRSGGGVHWHRADSSSTSEFLGVLKSALRSVRLIEQPLEGT